MNKSNCKYMDVDLGDLDGPDGNAWMMIAKCRSIMRQIGISKNVMKRFGEEAMSGDYAHVLATIKDWFGEVTYSHSNAEE